MHMLLVMRENDAKTEKEWGSGGGVLVWEGRSLTPITVRSQGSLGNASCFLFSPGAEHDSRSWPTLVVAENA